jgi:hypothetical protein
MNLIANFIYNVKLILRYSRCSFFYTKLIILIILVTADDRLRSLEDKDDELKTLKRRHAANSKVKVT